MVSAEAAGWQLSTRMGEKQGTAIKIMRFMLAGHVPKQV